MLDDEFVKSLIRHSYHEVVKKMKKQTQAGHPEITVVRA